VRTTLWGYVPDEATTVDDLIAEKYQGIRPAPGYPAQPDHTEKATLFRILNAEAEAGMAQMSKVYDETGRELYLGAGDREHD
jgi:5-methyltetrahydrofolate--homocysteine methyltransferase